MDMTSQAHKNYLDFLINHTLNPLPADKIDSVKFSSSFFSNTAAAVSELEKVVSVNLDASEVAALADGVYAEFALTGHGETDANTSGEVTGHSGGMLNETGIKFAEEQRDAVVKRPYIIVSSDLPRAIHHALIKFENLSDAEKDTLKETGEKVDAKKRPDEQDYRKLVDLALNHGIVPTPLARAQYYGRLELWPEKFELDYGAEKPYTARNLDEFAKKFKELKESGSLRKIKPAVNDFVESFFSENSDKELLRKMYKLALSRKDAAEYRSQGHLPEDENRLLFYHRVDALFSIFESIKKDLKDRRVEVVAHSGFVDVALEYFRHKSKKDEFHLKSRPKGDIRGETVIVKVDEKFEYLNDQKLLEPIREKARSEIRRLRQLSIDSLVREGKGIVKTLLTRHLGDKIILKNPTSQGNRNLVFNVSNNVYLDEILTDVCPAIIFGHSGQGKTILMTEIAKWVLDNPKSSTGDAYVPVMENCGDLNIRAKQTLLSGQSMYDYLRSSAGIDHLPTTLLKENKFVFLIDDYQKLNADFNKKMEDSVQRLNKDGHKVILFSRLEKPETLPPMVPGYTLFGIDPSKSLDSFISARLSDNDRGEFSEYVTNYEGVSDNYLSLAFLTMLFSKSSNNVLNYIQDEKIARIIKERQQLSSVQLYDALTDYVIGLDVERMNNNGLSMEEVRNETNRLKSLLGEKAACEEELPQLAYHVPSEWSYMDRRFDMLIDLDSRLQKELRGISLLHATRKIDLSPAIRGRELEDAKIQNYHPNGEYHVFIHDTFREFFVAKHIFEQMQINNSEPLYCRLSKKILDFLAEMNPNRDRLYEWIYSTRKNCAGEIGLLGGNSITLLSVLGEDLRGKDFSGTNISDAKLTDKNLEGMILRNANVIGVDFSCSNLNNVDVRGVVNLDRRLPESVDFTVIDFSFDNVYLLSKEGSLVKWNTVKGEVSRLKVAPEMMSFLSLKYGMAEMHYLIERRVSFNDGKTKVAIHHNRRLNVFDLIKGKKLLDIKTDGVDYVRFMPARSIPAELCGNEYMAMFQGGHCEFIELATGKDPLEGIKKRREEMMKKRQEELRKDKLRNQSLKSPLKSPISPILRMYREDEQEISWLEKWARAETKGKDPLADEKSALYSFDGSLWVSGTRIYAKHPYISRDAGYNPKRKVVSEVSGYDAITPLFFTPGNELLYAAKHSSEKNTIHIAVHNIRSKDTVLGTFNGCESYVLQGYNPVIVIQGEKSIDLVQFDKKTKKLDVFYRFDAKTFTNVIRD